MARALIENFIHLAENSVTVYDSGEDGRWKWRRTSTTIFCPLQ
jgi:hypothetical protein